MAPNNKGNNASAGIVLPNKSLPWMHGCKRNTCPGVCPLKVVVRQHGTTNPAKCKVCGQKFTLPPGSERLFPAKATAAKGGQAVTKQEQEIAKLKNQLAQSKQHIDVLRAGTPNSEKEGPEVSDKPSVKVPDIEKAIEVCKSVGASTVELEKQLAAAKEVVEKTGDPCRAILGKLNAAINREQQLHKQLAIDYQKLEATKSKLLEASATVLETQAQKELLLKKHGHIEPDPFHISPPQHLSTVEEQKWKDMCAEHFTTLVAKLKEAFTPPPATVVVDKELGGNDLGEPNSKAHKKEDSSVEPPSPIPSTAEGMDTKTGLKRSSEAMGEATPSASTQAKDFNSEELVAAGSYQEQAAKKLAISMQSLQDADAIAIEEQKEEL